MQKKYFAPLPLPASGCGHWLIRIRKFRDFEFPNFRILRPRDLEGCEALTRARIAAHMLAAVCARFVVKTTVGVAVAISWCGGPPPHAERIGKKCSVGVCVWASS